MTFWTPRGEHEPPTQPVGRCESCGATTDHLDGTYIVLPHALNCAAAGTVIRHTATARDALEGTPAPDDNPEDHP